MSKKKKKTKSLPSRFYPQVHKVSTPIFLHKFDFFLRKKIYVFLILFGLGGICYGNVSNGPFLFDDNIMVVKNQNIRSLGNIVNIFTSSITSGAFLEGGNFYRPFQVLIHTIIFQIFELNSSAYHIVSIICHIINSFLVFRFAQRLFQTRVSSFFASIIFLTHPIQTEAVSYISGLSDPLALMFVLLSLLFFLETANFNKSSPKKIYFPISIIFFIFALLSKESSVIFFLLLSVVMLFYKDKLREKSLERTIFNKLFIIGDGGNLSTNYNRFQL